MIVKRQGTTISGRKVTGLDDVPGLVRSGGGVAVKEKAGAKKDKLSFRGIVNITDIIAVDVGNGGEPNLGGTCADLDRLSIIPRASASGSRRSVVGSLVPLVLYCTASFRHWSRSRGFPSRQATVSGQFMGGTSESQGQSTAVGNQWESSDTGSGTEG